ncbi:MAG: GNAT family N-acetyltransferase [Sulfitobacter sp.]
MADIQIRRAAGRDLPQVLEMIHALAAHHGDTGTIDLDTLRRDALGDAPWITLLLAETRGALQGYTALCPLVQVQFGVRGMDMHHIYVTPQMRGRGVGRALIEAAQVEAKAQGCRYLMVGTQTGNTAAQSAYRAVGFEDATPSGPRFRMKV